MSDNKYNMAYVNALSEERNPKVLFEWICKLNREVIDLKDQIDDLLYELREIRSE